MPDQIIPALDRPAEQFAAVFPAEQELAAQIAALIAAGKRFGCWVVQHPDGKLWDDEKIAHFEDQAEAANAVAEFLEEHDLEDGPAPVLLPVQLPLPCITFACVACGEPLGDGEDIHRLHFETLREAEVYAEDADWTTDGVDWACSDCPVLEAPVQAMPTCPW